MKYVRCIREFHSVANPELDFGRLGSVYRVIPNPSEAPGYITLAELKVGYINKERFEEVTVS